MRVIHSPDGYRAADEAVEVQYDDKRLQITLDRLERRELSGDGLIDPGKERAVLEKALSRRIGIKPEFLEHTELAEVQVAIPHAHIFDFAGHGQFQKTKMGRRKYHV